MEAYKSHCLSCKRTYYWTGYKTGLGKTPQQLEQMKTEMTVCRHCGQSGLKTDLDHESPQGQAQDALVQVLARALLECLDDAEKRQDNAPDDNQS